MLDWEQICADIGSLSSSASASASKTQDHRCPLIFGVGHQKSGTTTIVHALGSIANLTSRNDIPQFWHLPELSDEYLLEILDQGTYGPIQKERSVLQYLPHIHRVCPRTVYYVVHRDILQTVRSVGDRLKMTRTTACPGVKHSSGQKSNRYLAG